MALNNEQLENFKAELKALLTKYDVNLNVDIQGDTHCLDTNFQVSDNKAPWNDYILGHYVAHVEANDL